VVSHVFWIKRLSNQQQITNSLADSDSQLMCVHQSSELPTCCQSLICHLEEICILTEKHSSKLCCSGKQDVILHLCCVVFICREDIDPSLSKPRGDRGIYVVVQIERNTQERSPNALSLSRTVDDSTRARIAATWRSCSSIARSISL
jgi:hypothetical protein